MAQDVASGPTSAGPGGPALGAREPLSTVEASGLSLAGLAPTMAMALGTAFAASEAGGAVPLSYVLGMIGSLALGFVIVKFARRYVASGVAFAYVRAAFGTRAGFTAGWIYAAAWMFGVAVNSAIASNSLVAVCALHHIGVSWLAFFVPMIVICAGINYVGVRPSVRAQVILELGSMVTLAGVMTYVVTRGGLHGATFAPFNPHSSAKGWGGIGFGLIFGFSGFVGFEGAAALGRETRNPRRSIPRALVYSLLGAGVFYIFVTYALAIGYGVTNAHTWATDATPLNTIANRFAGPVWAQVIDVMVAISGFSGAMGIVTLGSRIYYDMGRRGVGATWLVKVHDRFRTPSRLILIICAIALGTGILVGELTTPATIVGFIGTATTLGDIIVYVAICVAALRDFNRPSWRADESLIIRCANYVVPLVALGLLGFAFYSSVIPVPAFPYNLAPYVVLLVGVIGLLVYQRARRRAPAEDLALSEPAGGGA